MSDTARNNISQEQKISSIQKKGLNRFIWLKANFAYCLIVSALLWLVCLAYYIEHFIGWSSIYALAPTDFSVLILTCTLPIFLLWFLLAYIERSSSLDANALLFQTYINSLMYPDEKASQSARAIAAVLQDKIDQMRKESKEILSQSGLIKYDLEARVTELSELLKSMDNYSAQTLTELNASIKELADKCGYITDKTSHSASYLKDCTRDIAQNSDRFLSKLTPVLDEISVLSSNIKSNITDNKSHLINIREQLNACADISNQYVRDMLSKTDENTRRIEQSFYKNAEEYEALYKKLDSSISAVEGRIEEQKRLIQMQTQVINHNSDLINNKMVKYGSTVSTEIDKLVKNSTELEKITKKQIATLKAVNAETGAAIRGIGDVFDEKRMEIERRSEYAVNSMQNVIIAINKETEKLMSFTNLTQAKNHDLQMVSETIVDKIGDISNKLALKTDTLKDKAVEIIEKFTEAGELINRNTDKISHSSNLIVNNSRQSVKLIDEQNASITNTLNKLETLREKLQGLKKDIENSSGVLSINLSAYNDNIDKMEKIDPPEPVYDREKMLNMAKSINRVFRNNGINAEKMYENHDMFDLWNDYFNGNQQAFMDVLNSRLDQKAISSIRKSFDDNAEFHSRVVSYLFQMDLAIKEMQASIGSARDELLNLSVNKSLDKIYFILVKSLNSVD